jgi:hypothetical protein
MPGHFRADYIPDFPRRDGSTARWFQVVFAVGPGDAATLRTQVHDLFPRLLDTLSGVRLATDADLISLRARRHCPDSAIYHPERPFMFIEVDWSGTAFRSMRDHRDFSLWPSECIMYQNHFDAHYAFTRQYEGQPVC